MLVKFSTKYYLQLLLFSEKKVKYNLKNIEISKSRCTQTPKIYLQWKWSIQCVRARFTVQLLIIPVDHMAYQTLNYSRAPHTGLNSPTSIKRFHSKSFDVLQSSESRPSHTYSQNTNTPYYVFEFIRELEHWSRSHVLSQFGIRLNFCSSCLVIALASRIYLCNL